MNNPPFGLRQKMGFAVRSNKGVKCHMLQLEKSDECCAHGSI